VPAGRAPDTASVGEALITEFILVVWQRGASSMGDVPYPLGTWGEVVCFVRLTDGMLRQPHRFKRLAAKIFSPLDLSRTKIGKTPGVRPRFLVFSAVNGIAGVSSAFELT
jgi:hypothetical protein